MASSLAVPSLAGTRNLRPGTAKSSSPSGPSYISLFLRNLRLLDLDLRDDWPGITDVTFSTKDTQQNQKKRIQCVEWALYHLFALWNPEETRNKLRPFFPPLEHLQSLNLRTALFRCLDHAKKDGVLGRDAVLRKTMLDDCKGERLEELLAVFSNAVLKRVIGAARKETAVPIAEQLAFENFSYSGERTALTALILAHKASLQSSLRDRNDANARYHDFADLLNLNERRITRRHEQLKQTIQDRDPKDTVPTKEVYALQDQITNNWSGREDWLDTLLYGDAKVRSEDILSASFSSVWKHVESGTLGDIEERKHSGLLEQLDARLKSQETRLARWQDFGKTLSKSGAPSPAKVKDSAEVRDKRIDLGFNLHQNLHIGKNNPVENVEAPTHESFAEYTQLIDHMKGRLADVGKPPTLLERLATEDQSYEEIPSFTSSPPLQKREPIFARDEWSSISDAEEAEPSDTSYAKEPSPAPQTNPETGSLLAEANYDTSQTEDAPIEVSEASEDLPEGVPRSEGPRSISPEYSHPRAPPSITQELSEIDEAESDLADLILNSVSVASPSPKKMRHTLSLAERTRLSMSRTSHSQYSDFHDETDNVADLPRLKPRSSSPKAPSSSGEEKHADLIERTRKSMVGFEAAQKKAQLERRRSIKDAKKKQRESNYFPKVEEEPSRSSLDPSELIEGDPDYESVFKSRPKIKTSPAVSPTRVGNED